MSTATGFAPIDHARRVVALQEWLGNDGAGCDSLLITDLVDVRWLTGFGGSNGWVVVRTDDVILGTDGRYGERAIAETSASGVRVVAEQSRARLHSRMIEALSGATRVGLDAAETSHADWLRLDATLPLASTPSPIKRQRQIKDDAEIARMQAAAAAADAALGEVQPMLLGTVDEPVTEADVRDELEYRMRRHGADDRSYETIVASGPDNAARPHHEVGRRTIVEGDTVIVDVGALVEGYHSDMTRSYVIGSATARQREVYDLVSASHRAGIETLRDGVTAEQVDSVCRQVFADAGFGDWYLHGTGHGVGLEIHESPFHSQASDEVITAGNVVTIEPGLYRGGFGGFRIEDLLVVTEHGSRPLTHTPQQPFSR